MSFLAQLREIPLGKEFRGIGPLGDPTNAPATFARLISNIIGFMTIVAGLWFTFQVLLAGFQWLASGGDKTKLEGARGKLTSAVIGLAIVVFAIFFIRLITALLGIETILNIEKAVGTISPK